MLERFEKGDVAGLVAILADDAILSVPPWAYWQTGRDAIRATLEDVGTWYGQRLEKASGKDVTARTWGTVRRAPLLEDRDLAHRHGGRFVVTIAGRTEWQ